MSKVVRIVALAACALAGCGGGAGNHSDAASRGGNGGGGPGGNGAAGTAGTGAGGHGGTTGTGGGSTKTDGSAPYDAHVATCAGDACPACGLAGLPCCTNSVCSDSALYCNPDTFVCVECGGPGQPCCSTNPTCSGPWTCWSSVINTCGCKGDAGVGGCTQCGGIGQRCCSTGQACSSGLSCSSGGAIPVCAACGGPGQSCCDGGTCAAGGCCFLNSCVADGEACNITTGNYGVCSAGSCSCGHLGQPCCPRSDVDPLTSLGNCPDPTTVCQVSGGRAMCVQCGEAGEQCCGGVPGNCSATSACDYTNPEVFVCETCGVTGNPCCAGNKCNAKTDCCESDATTLLAGRCLAASSGCTNPNPITAGN
jgi:hypothetical protein